jgi:hypothetical protein
MSDALVGTKCCASSLLNYSNLNATQNCEKCAELEIQLQIVCDELSSVQLIIQMLNKEQVQKNYITTQIQHVDVEQGTKTGKGSKPSTQKEDQKVT